MQRIDSENSTPPLSAIPVSRPSSWVGMQVEWTSPSRLAPVLLGSLPRTHENDMVHIVGVRYDLAGAKVDGELRESGYFVEFIVVEEAAIRTWEAHRLTQRQSPAFSEIDESDDILPARKVSNPDSYVLRRAPRWKLSEATWPTHSGVPMMFHGQLELQESDLARRFFTWGFNIYLFSAPHGERKIYKIVLQETSFQTAEEHYADEARRAKRAAKRKRAG